ncbi:RNA-binding protein 33-like isoform X1 [Hylaeus volcanicus]|uniref:RNA-binding protein 33-like isoform X1 n=1 Tax=Hylaeus volcanicus TaxID=313075 RepID=UPI0023B79528|nr:RNA-binding protein 33-like isoform X1 [Hylaeus volcanicus]
MSEHDDTLLDEDLGDEEYDLGNDEEEALLADDYELERQNSYKGEEETDDVLDLGVTDALDDLDGEDENIEFSRSKANRSNDNDYYEDGDHIEVQSKYYNQDEIHEYQSEQARQHDERSASDSVSTSSNIGKGDLREKLQKNAKVYAGTGQGLEDDECEEAKERRNRFQNERTIVSPKMNNNIPDTLENVVTSEPSKLVSRGRGRGRSTRGSRGGRFNTQNSGNFNPRFSNARNLNFDNQPPACRPPLLEARPPFLLGVPNNVQNQQIIYQQSNSQVQPYQHYSPNGSLQGPTHFADNRPQFNPNQFQGQAGPRVIRSWLDYGPRMIGPWLAGSLQGPPYNHPSNQPPYVQNQPGPFQSSGVVMQDNQTRLMQNNQGPLLQGNLGGSLVGNLNPLVPGTPAPLLQGNQTLPLQAFPRQPSSQGPSINHPNVQIANQSISENRPSFQETQFENRSVYDSRSGYNDQVPTSQFNTNTLPVPQQSSSNVPNVPLPPGHKILINPHFRGAVQSTNDAARLVWDSAQQTPLSSQIPSNQFPQVSSYQNQSSYNQTQQGPPHYQQNYQQNKSDDPYAYFSDVWQENKPQKSQSESPSKHYPTESNYSRESNYECGPKYKSDQWDQKDSYQEDHRGVHQNQYRDRDVSSKTRSDHLPKSRTLSSNAYRESYDLNHAQKSPSNRPVNTSIRARLPQKRASDSIDRPLRDLSPKRMKPSNRNLQEVRTVDSLNSANSEKKDEENDPEMQEYRKKMEEQKRLREKILREKENRRKMAAMEKQNEETKNDNNTYTSSENAQDTKPVSVLMGVVKDASTNKSHIAIGRGRGRPINTQATEAAEKPTCVRIVRTIQTVQSNDAVDSTKDSNSGHIIAQTSENAKILNAQSGTRRIVIQKSLSNTQKIATSIQKTVSNLQKGQLIVQNKTQNLTQNLTQTVEQNQSDALKKLTAVGQKIGGNLQRIVKQKAAGRLQKTVINVQELTNVNTQKVVINTQGNQRVALQKTQTQQRKLPEIKTNIVKIENLAASTSEAQIRRMCQGIGTLESIQMGERSATIVFKTQSAAMVFHKKYQRKMLDLSLITVRLIPQSSGAKTTATIVKVS